jgi:hypothetical protein
MKLATLLLVLAWPSLASAATQTNSSVYTLNGQITNFPPYYTEITGIPFSRELTPSGFGEITTDGFGRIAGAQEVEIPAAHGPFSCQVSGIIAKYSFAGTTVRMAIKGNGYVTDTHGNNTPASLALNFHGGPMEYAKQTAQVITVPTNVALVFNDGTVDAAGLPVWATNLTDFLVSAPVAPVTNVFSPTTITNLLLDGVIVPLAEVSGQMMTNIVPGKAGISSFSFTNDWAVLHGTLSGGWHAAGKATAIKDSGATFVQTHYTNWLGGDLVVDGTGYRIVYSLLVPGNMELNILDSLLANFVQAGTRVSGVATNFVGRGALAPGAHGHTTTRVHFNGVGQSRGSMLDLIGTNGTVITSYSVNSNAPPVIVNLFSSVGVPPVISLTNTVSGILQLPDVVNYVTNGNLLIESHYGPADLTNPAYITNTAAGVITTFKLQGRIKGQGFSNAGGYNASAPYQLLPIGEEP